MISAHKGQPIRARALQQTAVGCPRHRLGVSWFGTRFERFPIREVGIAAVPGVDLHGLKHEAIWAVHQLTETFGIPVKRFAELATVSYGNGHSEGERSASHIGDTSCFCQHNIYTTL